MLSGSRRPGAAPPAGYGSTLHRSSSPRKPPVPTFSKPAVSNLFKHAASILTDGTAIPQTSPRPGSALSNTAGYDVRQDPKSPGSPGSSNFLADFRKGYSADKRKQHDTPDRTPSRPAETQQPSSGALNSRDALVSEIAQLRGQVAAQRAEYDRLGFSSAPGGAAAVAAGFAEAKAEAAELKAALMNVRDELQHTRDALANERRRFALIEEREKRRNDGEGVADAMERGESMARKAALLARITTVRSVASTVVSLLEHARKRLHKGTTTAMAEASSPGDGSAGASPPSPLKPSSREAWQSAEGSVADALSTLRTLANEQDGLARDLISLGRLLPPDEALADLTRQLLLSRANESEARTAVELAEEQRDTARAEAGHKLAQAGQAIAVVSAKLSEQITRADNLEQQLAAERPRGGALENALMAAQSTITGLQADKASLQLQVGEMEARMGGYAKTLQEAQASLTQAQAREKELQAALDKQTSHTETLARALAYSEVQRSQAEGRANDAQTLAAKADMGYIQEKNAKLALNNRVLELETAQRALTAQLASEETRRRGMEDQLASMAARPNGAVIRSASPHLKAYGAEEPARPRTLE